MRSREFDNGTFNVEYMYNPERDSLQIIEVKACLVSEITDRYEKVDGFQTY